jgi:hypothetical protein
VNLHHFRNRGRSSSTPLGIGEGEQGEVEAPPKTSPAHKLGAKALAMARLYHSGVQEAVMESNAGQVTELVKALWTGDFGLVSWTSVASSVVWIDSAESGVREARRFRAAS